jgi:hypothetical protein
MMFVAIGLFTKGISLSATAEVIASNYEDTTACV